MTKQYEFLAPREDRGFCVFPDDMEKDPLVFFHGTKLENLKLIEANGFVPPEPDSESGLGSVSFAKRSSAALDHAIRRREKWPGEYCIIAVRYESIEHPWIRNNPSDIHDDKLDPQPTLIGYNVIPAAVTYIWND